MQGSAGTPISIRVVAGWQQGVGCERCSLESGGACRMALFAWDLALVGCICCAECQGTRYDWGWEGGVCWNRHTPQLENLAQDP